MKKRYIFYVLFSILLGIFTWYVPSPATWLIAALGVGYLEVIHSRRPSISALVVTLVWLGGLLIYALYWAGVIILGFGGEQLIYLKMSTSPDWAGQYWQFILYTLLPHLLKYGLLGLVIAPILGFGSGWLVLKRRPV